MTVSNIAFGNSQRTLCSAFSNAGFVVAVIDVGDTGAVTLQQWNAFEALTANSGTYTAASTTAPTAPVPGPGTQNVATISRTSAGLYVLTMQGQYQRILGFGITFSFPTTVNSGLSNVAMAHEVTPAGGIDAPGVFTVLTFQCLDFAGGAVDPTSGSQMRITLFLDDSEA